MDARSAAALNGVLWDAVYVAGATVHVPCVCWLRTSAEKTEGSQHHWHTISTQSESALWHRTADSNKLIHAGMVEGHRESNRPD
ncbi:MAG: hypothetical protein GY826_44130 [Fuerstiella sp.]|nr:hypothetical protein [Fuerstiella sp.]